MGSSPQKLLIIPFLLTPQREQAKEKAHDTGWFLWITYYTDRRDKDDKENSALRQNINVTF